MHHTVAPPLQLPAPPSGMSTPSILALCVADGFDRCLQVGKLRLREARLYLVTHKVMGEWDPVLYPAAFPSPLDTFLPRSSVPQESDSTVSGVPCGEL